MRRTVLAILCVCGAFSAVRALADVSVTRSSSLSTQAVLTVTPVGSNFHAEAQLSVLLTDGGTGGTFFGSGDGATPTAAASAAITAAKSSAGIQSGDNSVTRSSALSDFTVAQVVQSGGTFTATVRFVVRLTSGAVDSVVEGYGTGGTATQAIQAAVADAKLKAGGL